jgi:hypothetical protein
MNKSKKMLDFSKLLNKLVLINVTTIALSNRVEEEILTRDTFSHPNNPKVY